MKIRQLGKKVISQAQTKRTEVKISNVFGFLVKLHNLERDCSAPFAVVLSSFSWGSLQVNFLILSVCVWDRFQKVTRKLTNEAVISGTYLHEKKRGLRYFRNRFGDFVLTSSLKRRKSYDNVVNPCKVKFSSSLSQTYVAYTSVSNRNCVGRYKRTTLGIWRSCPIYRIDCW